MSVALDGNAKGAAQTQVSNLTAHNAVINQQVLGLQVTVHDAVLVAVGKAFNQLVDEALRGE
jgi:hypothetical protein